MGNWLNNYVNFWGFFLDREGEKLTFGQRQKRVDSTKKKRQRRCCRSLEQNVDSIPNYSIANTLWYTLGKVSSRPNAPINSSAMRTMLIYTTPAMCSATLSPHTKRIDQRLKISNRRNGAGGLCLKGSGCSTRRAGFSWYGRLQRAAFDYTIGGFN